MSTPSGESGSEAAGRREVVADGVHVPKDLREAEVPVWVTWDVRDKVALAPWDTGHMYRATWAEGKNNPRVGYERARAVADLPVDEIHRAWPFPDGDDLPETVKPTVLLPHIPECPTPRYVFVDYDNVVRADGTVSDEVWSIMKRLGGPVFFSRSGTGLHQWVRGRLPDGFGKVDADLHVEGSIEMYDHGRMTGETWRHVRGTPRDELPEREETIAELVETYADEERKESAAREVARRENAERSPAEVLEELNGGGSTDGGQSPYYSLDLASVADRGPFAAHRHDGGDEWRGPHPAHGGTSHADSESTNFNLDPTEGVWCCYACGDGGRALRLIGVLEGVLSCGATDRLRTDDEALAKVCLYARDKYSDDLDDAKPPYRALAAVARRVGLSFADEDEGILGSDTHRLAWAVFDDLDAEAFDEL